MTTSTPATTSTTAQRPGPTRLPAEQQVAPDEFRDRLLARRGALVEQQIETIRAALAGGVDAVTGETVAPAVGGYRDQLLSNLDEEIRVLGRISATLVEGGAARSGASHEHAAR